MIQPLVSMNLKCTLHFKKYSSVEFKGKTVCMQVVDGDSQKEIERKDIDLAQHIKGSAVEGEEMFNLCLSNGGFSMISLSWKLEDQATLVSHLSLKSALSMKVVTSNLEVSPKLMLDLPRSKTMFDDNITYNSGMCNNREPPTPVVVEKSNTDVSD
jgi:hypothetical protein